MDLEALNEFLLLEGQRKPIIKLKELQLNLPYQISSANVTASRFGECVVLELEDKVVYLPPRSTEVLKNHTLELGNGRYSLVFIGEKDTNKGNPATLFKFVKS
uniref:Uncharacterized protein LOC114347288 n=1 Tax=Diabrotica virgifera virgifera TaxID=50390 RepID=A0A6P7HDH0_DIAVI